MEIRLGDHPAAETKAENTVRFSQIESEVILAANRLGARAGRRFAERARRQVYTRDFYSFADTSHLRELERDIGRNLPPKAGQAYRDAFNAAVE